ncbi:hypothetical protein PV326_002003 [Microctonus aethiopoides]|nr:hypothetical protein PV326_002003 [Microctonus aethiopoides]
MVLGPGACWLMVRVLCNVSTMREYEPAYKYHDVKGGGAVYHFFQVSFTQLLTKLQSVYSAITEEVMVDHERQQWCVIPQYAFNLTGNISWLNANADHLVVISAR